MRQKQSSKGFRSLVFLTLVVAAALLFVGGSVAQAADFDLIIATWEPHGDGSAPYKAWLKDLTERTGGKVTGNIRYAAMGPPPSYYDLAAKGLVHVAFVGIPYTPGRFPMQEVMQLPLSGEVNSENLAKAYWALYKKGYFDQEMKDVQVLWLCGQAPYHLQMIKGKDVLKISDIKGKKLRASGDLHTSIVKALGGIPVGMPAPETPIAMQKGTIDGTFQGWSFISDFRTEKITRSATEVGVSSVIFAMVMNKKMYNSLPGDVKKVMEEMGPEYSAIGGRGFDGGAAKGMELFENAGGVVHKLPPEEVAQIGDLMAPIWKSWIEDKEARGLPGKKIVADLYQILKDQGVEKPFHGYTP